MPGKIWISKRNRKYDWPGRWKFLNRYFTRIQALTIRALLQLVSASSRVLYLISFKLNNQILKKKKRRRKRFLVSETAKYPFFAQFSAQQLKTSLVKQKKPHPQVTKASDTWLKHKPIMVVSAYELHGERQLYAFYGASMFIILSVGLVGNALTLLVLLHPDHRSKTMTSLMVNLCVAGRLLS